MEKPSDGFSDAIGDLRVALDEVLKPLLDKENGKLLAEVVENQLSGMEKFYRLLLAEQGGIAMIDGPGFDRVVEKYRRVSRFFTRFPGLPERSTYKMSVVSDLYYILSRHTQEWGRPED